MHIFMFIMQFRNDCTLAFLIDVLQGLHTIFHRCIFHW